MDTFSLDTIASQFYTAGVNYSAAIQPYALHLFFALFLIDILATWIQYTAEGQLDPSFFFGRYDQARPQRRFRLPDDHQWLLVDVSGDPEFLANWGRD